MKGLSIPSEFRRFPAQWKVMPFLEVISDETGGNPKVLTSDYLNTGTLPVIDQGNSAIAGYVNEVSLKCKAKLPCILFGDHTKIFKFVDHPFTLGADGVKVLVPTADLDPKFAYHYLKQVRLPDNAGYSRHFKFLKETYIPLPPLPEQKRIAAILDKADSIRRKRQEAVRLTDELLRSVFLEIFGDPVVNPKGWEVVEFGELCEDLRYGTSNMCSTDRQGGDLPVLRIPNVIGGLLNWDNMKHVQLPDAEVKRLRLEQGDMLFVRTNGNPEYIGRCAVYDDTRTAIYASYLIRARLKKESPCLPQYASSCFTYPSYRQRLVAEAKTTAGNYNINTEGLKSLKLPVPPKSTQLKYLTLRNRLATSIVKMQVGVDFSDTLYNCLLQRAFKEGI